MIKKIYSKHFPAVIMLGIVLSISAVFAQTESIITPASSDAAPEQVVVTLEQALLNIMQAEQLDHAGRSQRLQPVIERVFNFPRMGRFLFGSRWNTFDPAQQSNFMNSFQALTIATYAARFNSFNDQQFVAVSAMQPGSNRAQVRHQLLTGKGEQIAFDYLLLQENDQWRIVNITTRGVSDLALKRTQYSKLYNQGGLEAVLDYLQQQVERLVSE